MYQKALAGRERALGPGHTSTLDTVHNIGRPYWKQGKPKKAEEMYKQALAGRERALGSDHTSTLDTVDIIGNLYKKQGKLQEAEEMYQQALAGYKKTLGPEHSKTQIAAKKLLSFASLRAKQDNTRRIYNAPRQHRYLG
ncbi:Tetratricopeptide repeat-domain-containing protein [Aspergillus similis]